MNNLFKKFCLFALFSLCLIIPSSVLGDEPVKGDIRNNNITINDDNITINKEVTKTNTEGEYNVSFTITGKKITKNIPSYTVIILDASKSMVNINGNDSSTTTPWYYAKEAAKSFSKTLIDDSTNNYVSLITFNSSANLKRDFSNTYLTDTDFGNTSSSTNYNVAFIKALDTIEDIDDEYIINIIFISDGLPNSDNYSTSLANLKAKADNIYAVAYNLNGNSATSTLNNISTNNTTYSATNSTLDNVLQSIANEIALNAGSNATFIDNLGNNFSFTDALTRSYNKTIEKINDDAITFNFNIEIDPNSATGWHKTNNTFNLKYYDNNGTMQTITSTTDPEVYWITNSYDYTVNYYFDDILNESLTKTDSAYYNDVIRANNYYLTNDEINNNNLTNYKLHPLMPYDKESITIDNKNSNIINIYYITKTSILHNILKETLDKLTSSNQLITYNIKYTAKLTNVNGKFMVTVIDNLPLPIDTLESNLNGGIYKEEDNKYYIIWQEEITLEDFKKEYDYNFDKNFSVKYTNIDPKISYTDKNTLDNNAQAYITIDNKEYDKVEITEELIVEIYGNLKVLYITYDKNNNIVNLLETLEYNKLVGTPYTTKEEKIDGYEIKEIIGNTIGCFNENDTEVTYVYTKINEVIPPKTGINIDFTKMILASLLLTLITIRYKRKRTNLK